MVESREGSMLEAQSGNFKLSETQSKARKNLFLHLFFLHDCNSSGGDIVEKKKFVVLEKIV